MNLAQLGYLISLSTEEIENLTPKQRAELEELGAGKGIAIYVIFLLVVVMVLAGVVFGVVV